MSKQGRIWIAGFFSVALALAVASTGWSAPDTPSYVGGVIAVDKTAGKIVVGDMGPLLANGKSEIARRTVQVTPSTEFVKVKRTSAVAPSGWMGDFVETKLPAWEVKPGDWVAVAVKKGGSTALKIMVVETREP